ncbi:hypothetical protein K437DRAFT_248535 [Tilletiaria anomala UBC 951]|uniref:UspA domain-containing protein n=1 Tax=Tilletiaria anomala (strain ATCC 24038 / CBS 436.72 / UBC 951) TaxID=1037660 RepID=A0A066VSV9_TILAU|nr:uncharacterized protein K437DRAFT_248535 [Tilletiaria anomala UBC 951]KDN43333.1 hypothetical protein K437DRAFT_248535 [Tilletiaria anomala UBC 951]
MSSTDGPNAPASSSSSPSSSSLRQPQQVTPHHKGHHYILHHAAQAGISAALAPVLAIAEPGNNPFSIGALREDSTRTKGRRRKAFLRAGRSISPFRGSGHRRSSSATRLMKDPSDEKEEQEAAQGSSAIGRNRGAGNDRGFARNSDSDTSDSDEETDSASSPVCPRNNAFSSRGRSDSKGSTTTVKSSSSSLLEGEEETSSSKPAISNGAIEPENETGTEESIDEAEEEDDVFDIDPVLLDNTLFNAGCLDLYEGSEGEGCAAAPSNELLGSAEDGNDGDDEDEHITAPNVVLAESQAWQALRSAPKGSRSHTPTGDHALIASRPIFERNRCTITLVHGEFEAATATRTRPKRYVVASDGSEEAAYAAEWTIGTVLRDGDETLIVSVMETDSKFDTLDHKNESKEARSEHQKIRQNQALILARQATALLQRTRLGVRISCQAIHAKNARHMLLDLIDFYEPNMVIVGSRGLGSLKGILLGRTSHYLVQKSSVPVMVVRSRLRLPRLPKGKTDVVAHVKQKHLRLRDASIEKESNVTEADPDETAPTKDVETEESGGERKSTDEFAAEETGQRKVTSSAAVEAKDDERGRGRTRSGSAESQ